MYAKQYTKTYVAVGDKPAKIQARIGQHLELVPETDITKLKVGDNLKLKVYFDGKPYRGSGKLAASYAGYSTKMEDNFYPEKTVENGYISLPIPTSGRWFIRYSVRIPAPKDKAEKFSDQSFKATLVFQIDNDRKDKRKRG